MRTFVNGLVYLIVAAMAFGCASGKNANSGTSPSTKTIAAGDTKACVIQSDGHDVLRLTVPADTSCASRDGSLYLTSHYRNVEVWLVRGAQTVDEAVRRVGQVIDPEFKDFKASITADLAIAGSPAKRLTGAGTEADDGDPGEADIVVFQKGQHVFVVCTHGESLSSGTQQLMLTIVQTAQVP